MPAKSSSKGIVGLPCALLAAAVFGAAPSPAAAICTGGSVLVHGKAYGQSAYRFPSGQAAGAWNPFGVKVLDCPDTPGATLRVIGTTTAYKLPGVATALAVGVPSVDATRAIAVYTRKGRCERFASLGGATNGRARLMACLRWHTTHPTS